MEVAATFHRILAVPGRLVTYPKGDETECAPTKFDAFYWSVTLGYLVGAVLYHSFLRTLSNDQSMLPLLPYLTRGVLTSLYCYTVS